LANAYELITITDLPTNKKSFLIPLSRISVNTRTEEVEFVDFSILFGKEDEAVDWDLSIQRRDIANERNSRSANILNSTSENELGRDTGNARLRNGNRHDLRR